MFAVIRVRGNTGIRREIRDTARALGLDRANHLVLRQNSRQDSSMIAKAKDYVTWGEISTETLARLLEKRGLLEGNKRPGSGFPSENGFKDFNEMAEAIIKGKTTLEKLGMKRVFRLHPPRKGFERQGIKKSFAEGGALGYRAEAVNELILKMV